jgi:hypothetical protein
VLQVGPHGGPVAVEDLLDQRQLVERLVPELAYRLGAEHALAGARQRRRERQRAHRVRRVTCDRLRDPAADVVAGDQRPLEPQLVDQAEHTACLRDRRVRVARGLGVLVGLPEATEMRHHDVGAIGQQRHHRLVVAAVARPAVQEHHGRP